jgi:2-succinyl-5-enolpyruvyl-6-hydroxy-3-cyclohexene-1-carboxylate synthase
MIHANAAGEPGAANLRFARLLVDELQASGVVAAVVCPGSRSTPLALAVAGQRGLPYSVHLDERSAAFHALGHAKATGRPVALVCTSGTAGANFLPAVAEASHARVPLVVLTADRPPELRAWGAAQTMEQRSLYAGFARWSEEAPCPSEGVGDGYARALARRAVAEAMGAAPGPVHLNLPFREPLVPATIDVESLAGAVASAESTPPVLEPRDPDGTIVRALRSAKRGVLVFGPDAWDPSLADAATSLAAALGWPVVADPASGLRAGNIVPDSLVCHADLLLRHVATAAALQPEVILRFGGVPTAKAVNEWMACHAQAEVWLVDPAAGFRDPQHRAVRQLRLMPSQLAALVRAADVEPSTESLAWRSRWRNADRVAGSALTAALDGDARFLAPQLARALWSGLPARSALYAANSMAIRDLDAFAGPRAEPLRLLANRGVNGIDGLVSSALGAAQALRSPTVLWCGDLALLHDVSGLLAGQLHAADLTIVVSNDDGGGIFEYLPVARAVPREVFEPLFAVPHGLDLCALARGLGWQATRVASAEAFAAALAHAMAGGLHVIEVPVDRAANTALHARLNEAVRTALQEGPAA